MAAVVVEPAGLPAREEKHGNRAEISGDPCDNKLLVLTCFADPTAAYVEGSNLKNSRLHIAIH